MPWRRSRRRDTQALVFLGEPGRAESLLTRIEERGATYGTRATAADAGVRRKAIEGARRWAPQVLLFDRAMGPGLGRADPGRDHRRATPTLGALTTSLCRRFRRFLEAFRGWWDAEPLGWQQRTFEAVSALGWAARRAAPGDDVAVALESMRDRRFGGLDLTFGPDDHTAVEQTSVGLWVVPRPGTAPEADRLPDEMPWVPLARGFSIDGETLDLDSQDWRYLVTEPAPSERRRLHGSARLRFGVVTSEKDPIH